MTRGSPLAAPAGQSATHLPILRETPEQVSVNPVSTATDDGPLGRLGRPLPCCSDHFALVTFFSHVAAQPRLLRGAASDYLLR